MNEEEMSRLMKTYGDSLGNPGMPAARTFRNPWGRRVSIGAACASVVVIGLLMAWPRDAVAGTLARIHKALTNVTTMEVVSYATPPKPALVISTCFYKSNMWRFESGLGTNLERTFVFRDGMELSDWKKLDFSTLQTAPKNALEQEKSQGQTALEYVESFTDVGAVSETRSITIQEHAPFRGRPTYAVVMKRDVDYDGEILVDRDTDLPIYSEVKYVGSQHQSMVWHADFTFNQPLADSLFSLASAKTQVHLPEAVSTLADEWARPLGQVSKTEVHDVSITSDGTIWIASTSPSASDSVALPTRLTDDVGTQYILAQDAVPSAMTDDEDLKINGKSIYVSIFTPLKPGGPLPTALHAGFFDRQPQMPGFSTPLGGEGRDLGKSLDLKPRLEANAWPGYFRFLNLASFLLQVPMVETSARAMYFDEKHYYLAAAEAYEQFAKARYNWVKYSAYKPMLEEARCYRQLGQTQRADALTKQANDLKASAVR